MSSHVSDTDIASIDRYNGELRVTADLDDARPFDVVRAVSVFRDAGLYDIEARVSSSGEGFHVRAWGPAEMSDRAVERLRRTAGDHAARIDWDATHATKPTQILFSRKPGGEAGPWRSDPWDAVDDLLRRSQRHDSGDPRPYRVTGWFE